MAHMIITDTCTACGSCEDVCPNKAISHKGKVFTINPKKCKDCVGSFDAPQCVDVCQSGSCVPVAA
ncbi:4Fe-4S binding protein [Rhodoplanes sp. TEM]|uniref:4Fe-4S binding protein n=1 Tax=Rhodoplanes tepidamans TaxID=200616 RepID=A0ABT5J6D5_RHOTP|nr:MULTISPECIES: 4Fe-4S binding protein [Rhodoplanes]MDC7785217.1 4Fe-4S binding protein [Rhodoplanes tepidamans]MDC7986742.1 4Fe-4S binding protein [Rhodoplanes sp. TEM]MDQ0353475.1 ferredoxin [Rhodoplanes tepidamans]